MADQKPTEKRIIVVIGMHRSGTSVVARGLLELGVPLGNALIKPAAVPITNPIIILNQSGTPNTIETGFDQK